LDPPLFLTNETIRILDQGLRQLKAYIFLRLLKFSDKKVLLSS